MWAVLMKTYLDALDALDLWEAIEEDYEVPLLSANRRGLRGPSAFSKSYYSTNKSTEGKEDKEIKGKSLPICRCISNDLHANNVPQNNKINLGLSQG